MRVLRAASALLVLSSALPARALENSALAASPDDGRAAWRSEVVDRPVYPNLEGYAPGITRPWCESDGSPAQPVLEDDPCAASPGRSTAGYRLSIDGNVLDGDGRSDAESQRCTDVRLAAAGIRVQSDAHLPRKVLSVGAWPDRAWRGQPISFTGYWNYSAFIARSEVRLFALGQSPKARPFAVRSLDAQDRAVWTPTGADGISGFRLVLRVYDAQGRFDETEPYDVLIGAGERPALEGPVPERERATVYGKTRLVLDRIPVAGALVTVSGDRLKPGSRAFALGREAPVSPEGAFAVEEILPPGRHDVAVRIDGPAPLEFLRPIYVAKDRWFYVALADLTAGGNKSKGPAALVRADTAHYDHAVFLDGRAAFYLKGQIKGDWLLTASADTREQPLSNVFSSLDEKDPRYLLRRLDPDRYYPVYGDDSTFSEDAPTQGKFYVRLERGESQVLWGNYAIRLRGNELVPIDRTLYGGRLHAVTDSTTRFGERRASLDAFVGDPGTLRAREEYRGTGGSLYYLQHLDITPGSDLISIEIRDKDSGLVLRTRDLAHGQDYDFDALQGRLVLSSPLPSTADDGLLVRSGDLSGNPVFLVVRYEYQPGLLQLRDYVTGGRASAWLGDHLEVGATASRQREGFSGESRIGGADATLRYTPNTYLKGEVAQTKGPGPGERSSTDGGFSFAAVSQDRADLKANAARAEAAIAFADLRRNWDGRATGYWKGRERGFAGPGQLTLDETVQYGGTLTQPLPWKTQIDVKYDQTKEMAGQKIQNLDLDVKKGWGDHWSTSAGSRSSWRRNVAVSSSAFLSQEGSRTDVAFQLGYDSLKRWSAYGFGQGQADKFDNRLKDGRYGLGGRWSPTDRWSLTGEGSRGARTMGGKLGTEARVSERSTIYGSYQLDTQRTDNQTVGRVGQFVTGARSRYTDSTTIFGEERWQHGTGPTGLTHAYGLDIAAEDGWRYGLTGEHGTLSDPRAGDFSRTAMTGSIGLSRTKVKWTSSLEYREERGQIVRRTWLTRNNIGYQVHPDWRLLTKLAYSFSGSSQGDFFIGEYTEGVFGFAYRPTKNDKLNALIKYTFFRDLASPGQLTVTSATPDYRQRSHIFSGDATYDLMPALSIGGKYALRLAQVQVGRVGSSPWFSSTAHLGILRLDWHVVRHWDAIVEGRHLRVVEARDSRTGALLALYRHVGKNLMLGGGYNFTDFSDELTDLSYTSHGWFVNLIAKF